MANQRNLDGTTRSTFTVGPKSEEIAIRSNSGRAEFRDAGGAFEEIASKLISISFQVTAGPHDLTGAASRSYHAGAGTADVVFTLPLLSAVAQGHTLFLASYPTTGSTQVVTGDRTDKIEVPALGQREDLKSTKYGSCVALVAYPGFGTWFILNAVGEWSTGGDPTQFYNWDGNRAGMTENHLAAFDAYGNAKDSGLAVAPLSAPLSSENASRALTQADDGKRIYTASGGVDPVVFTLPGAVTVGTELEIMAFGANARITAPSGISIGMPWALVTNDSIEAAAVAVPGAISLIRIRAISSTLYQVSRASGKWWLVSDSSKLHQFDGNVPGATESNLASFDEYGNVKDSGLTSLSAIGVVTNDGEPTLVDGQTVIWIDSADSNRTYLLHRRAVDSVQVSVELT